MSQFAEYAILDALGCLDVWLILDGFYRSALLVVERFGNVDHNVYQLVARAVAPSRGNTLATHSEHLAGQSAAGKLQAGASVYGRYFYRSTEGSCRNIEHEVVDHIIAIAD